MTSPFAPFGLDLSAVFTRFDTLEDRMSAIDDALAALTAQDDTLSAVDALSAKLTATSGEVASLDTEVGDADGSDNPV